MVIKHEMKRKKAHVCFRTINFTQKKRKNNRNINKTCVLTKIITKVELK